MSQHQLTHDVFSFQERRKLHSLDEDMKLSDRELQPPVWPTNSLKWHSARKNYLRSLYIMSTDVRLVNIVTLCRPSSTKR